MATTPIPGYIKKSDAARLYKRDHRTIGKDITLALSMRDENILKHLKLRTKDGRERDGLDLDVTTPVTLRDEGMVPTWYLEKNFFDGHYRPDTDNDEPDNTFQEDPPHFQRVIDAETVPNNDDDSSTALLANPIIAMQSKRITELERDRQRDINTIETLTKAVDLLEKLWHEEQEASAGRFNVEATTTKLSKNKSTKTKARATKAKTKNKTSTSKSERRPKPESIWTKSYSFSSLFTRSK